MDPDPAKLIVSGYAIVLEVWVPRAELASVYLSWPVMKSQTPTQLRVTVTAIPAFVDTLIASRNR